MRESISDSYWRALLVLMFLFSTLMLGFSDAIGFTGFLYFMIVVFQGSFTALWVTLDAKSRGYYLVHIVQLLAMIFWPIAWPTYLIWSRGWLRGIGWTLVGVLAYQTFGIAGYITGAIAMPLLR